VSVELPLNWRTLTVAELRQWIRDSGYEMPYMLYAKREHIVHWIEQTVTVPRCPTCGRPT
jgi:hypothetical protein